MTLEALRLRVANRLRAKERFRDGERGVAFPRSTCERLSETERKAKTGGTVDATYRTLLQWQEKVSRLCAQQEPPSPPTTTFVICFTKTIHERSHTLLLNPHLSWFTRRASTNIHFRHRSCRRLFVTLKATALLPPSVAESAWLTSRGSRNSCFIRQKYTTQTGRV